ncbi:MAG: O-antigen ligase family protein [Eubacteriales bacterium]
METEHKELTAQNSEDEIEEIPDRLFDGEKLVFNWDKCAFVILICWCLQPVLTMAAQIVHPVAGGFVGTLSFFLIGISACIICLLYLLDRINYEKSGFFIRIWKYQRWNVFLFTMLVWGGVAALLANNINIAMMGTIYRLDGYLSYIIYAGFYGCGLILSDKNKLMKVFKIFAGASVILGISSLIALIPAIRSTPNIYIISLWYMRGTSVFSNINHYGYYLVMAIICAAGLFVYEKNRIKSVAWLAVALFNSWVLIDNTSFGSYIAVFAGLTVLAFIGKFKIKPLIPVISFVILSVCLMPVYNIIDNFSQLSSDYSKYDHIDLSAEDNGRPAVWLQTVKIILEKPVFGYGPEGLTDSYGERMIDCTETDHHHTTYFDRPQNEYLQHAAFMGIPALLLYLAALITLFMNRIKNNKKLSAAVLIAFCAVIGYAVSAFFGNTMYYTTPFFFMLLGITAHISQNNITEITKEDAK